MKPLVINLTSSFMSRVVYIDIDNTNKNFYSDNIVKDL